MVLSLWHRAVRIVTLDLHQFRALAAACWRVGGHQACPATSIDTRTGLKTRKTRTKTQKTTENRKPENRPVVQARLRSVDQNQEVREHLHTAWPISSCGLPLLRNVMATLIDFGWTPHDPQLWTSPKGDWWRYARRKRNQAMCVSDSDLSRATKLLWLRRSGARRGHDWFPRATGVARKEGNTWQRGFVEGHRGGWHVASGRAEST